MESELAAIEESNLISASFLRLFSESGSNSMIREQWNDILTVRVPLQQLVKTRLLNLENLFRNTAEKINTRKSASNKKKI